MTTRYGHPLSCCRQYYLELLHNGHVESPYREGARPSFRARLVQCPRTDVLCSRHVVNVPTLNQLHIMGGFPIVAIGYEVADALERYQRQHHIAGVPSFKQLLQRVESEISMPISLARLEDSSGLTRSFCAVALIPISECTIAKSSWRW